MPTQAGIYTQTNSLWIGLLEKVYFPFSVQLLNAFFSGYSLVDVLIYFCAKSGLVARLRGHDRFFVIYMYGDFLRKIIELFIKVMYGKDSYQQNGIFLMTLLQLFILIIASGVLLWLVNSFIPMPAMIKSLLNLLVLIVLVIYILQFFGIIKMLLPFPNIFR